MSGLFQLLNGAGSFQSAVFKLMNIYFQLFSVEF